MKNIFKQEKIILQLTFNPGLALTGFRTTQPRVFPFISAKIFITFHFFIDSSSNVPFPLNPSVKENRGGPIDTKTLNIYGNGVLADTRRP